MLNCESINLITEQKLVYQIPAPAEGSPPFTYTLKTGPVGMQVDPTTGRLAWTPTSEEVGNHPITVEIKDTNDLVFEHEFEINVSNGQPEPPSLFVVPDGGADVTDNEADSTFNFVTGQNLVYNIATPQEQENSTLTYTLLPDTTTGHRLRINHKEKVV